MREKGPFWVRKFGFFPFIGSWYILPAHLDDKALPGEQPERLVGKQTDGQGRDPALDFPAHPELCKAINSGVAGAEPLPAMGSD